MVRLGRVRLPALVAGGVVLSALALTAPGAQRGAGLLLALLALAVGWSHLLAGVFAWLRRPEASVGPLMVAFGLSWLTEGLAPLRSPLLSEAGLLLGALYPAFLGHLLLTFPDGFPRGVDGRVARGVVAAAYSDTFGVQLALLVLDDAPLEAAIRDAQIGLGVLLGAVVLGLLARRWRLASRPARRAIAPVLLSGGLAVGAFLLLIAMEHFAPGRLTLPVVTACVAVFLSVPVGFLVGLLRTRLAHAGIADALVELGTAAPPGALRDALARGLGDPSLALAYWLPGQRRYVDAEGRPLDLPADGDRRVATVVRREGRTVAALVHDRSLCEDPALLDAASAAAALALENERLQADLRARLEELAASRARLVEAGDAERRRIERNLHDGTQQRLVSVSMALGLASSRLAVDPDAARDLLDEARTGLAGAMEELRRVSSGIHPAILTERGLTVALNELVYGAPFPVELSSSLPGRLPEPVEAAAYYVAAEALANAAKHAHARAVRIELAREVDRAIVTVTDDGRGGADLDTGSGLRGLADRVAALGGRLTVHSPRGGGTMLRAELPCAS